MPVVGLILSTGMLVTFVGLAAHLCRTGFQTACDDEVHTIQQHLDTNINLLR